MWAQNNNNKKGIFNSFKKKGEYSVKDSPVSQVKTSPYFGIVLENFYNNHQIDP